MKTIQNKTAKPLKIHLAGGKVLHLGPHKTGQVADNATEQPSLKRRIDAGEVSVLGEGGPVDAAGEASGPRHETTHGHHSPTVAHRRGNR
jgi:hypothetical protein